ncbi:MAG: hypothetical protein QNJ02_16490 [Desulfobacterales bacterium]|nr:hypothetical protein [Desulfobacterales bacterium]
MKAMVSVMCVVLLVCMLAPTQAGGEVQARRAYYESAIAQEIAACRAKRELRSSRSPNLRMKGHREASKALFLETHKAQLVESMVALNIEAKNYKVARFLNDRFNNTCYAQWTSAGKI